MQAAELARAVEAAEGRMARLVETTEAAAQRALSEAAARLRRVAAERDAALQALIDRDLELVSAAITGGGGERGEVEDLRRELDAAKAAKAAAEAAAEAARAEVRPLPPRPNPLCPARRATCSSLRPETDVNSPLTPFGAQTRSQLRNAKTAQNQWSSELSDVERLFEALRRRALTMGERLDTPRSSLPSPTLLRSPASSRGGAQPAGQLRPRAHSAAV